MHAVSSWLSISLASMSILILGSCIPKAVARGLIPTAPCFSPGGHTASSSDVNGFDGSARTSLEVCGGANTSL